jgi:lipid A 3-O-deacylase
LKSSPTRADRRRRPTCGWAALACAAATLLPAQETPAQPTGAAPLGLHFEAVVVSFENDKFFAGSDRHYTQGGRITFLYNADAVSPLTKAARGVLTEAAKLIGDRRLEETRGVLAAKDSTEEPPAFASLAVSIGQDMFTPTDTETAALVPGDRPYAAWLYVAPAFHIAGGRKDAQGKVVRETSFIAELSLGVVGPSALGETLQNGWHDVINVPHSQGWDNQLHDEPGLNLAFEWRQRHRQNDWIDLVPRAALVLGNVATHLSVGGSVRFGPNLPDDFGHDLIRAGSGNVARPTGFSPYVFLSADARAVARNIFLDGNTWRGSHSVRKRPVVADLSAGFAANWPRFRLIYAQNYRTKEFYGQPKRDVFGSVSFVVLF